MVHRLIDAAAMTGTMAWEILWALCLGFLLSSVVEVVVSKAQMSRLLPDSSAAGKQGCCHEATEHEPAATHHGN